MRTEGWGRRRCRRRSRRRTLGAVEDEVRERKPGRPHARGLQELVEVVSAVHAGGEKDAHPRVLQRALY